MRKLLIILLCFPIIGICQNIYPHLIANIDGDNAYDRFGYSVDINSNGSVIAISAIGDNSTEYVRVYGDSLGNYYQIGQDITSPIFYSNFCHSVSLSDDGNIIAVSNSTNNQSYTLVQVYENIGGVWTQIGQNISEPIDYFGQHINLSGDGTTLAIGGNGSPSTIKVYENNSGSWIQKGSDFYVGNALNFSLNYSGSRIAIGHSEKTQVFDFVGSSWTQVGQDIDIIIGCGYPYNCGIASSPSLSYLGILLQSELQALMVVGQTGQLLYLFIMELFGLS